MKRYYSIAILLIGSLFCVNAIVNGLQVSQPAISQHLKVLREAGLVNIEKKGYWAHYSSNKEKIDEFLKAFLKISELKEGGEECVRKNK